MKPRHNGRDRERGGGSDVQLHMRATQRRFNNSGSSSGSENAEDDDDATDDHPTAAFALEDNGTAGNESAPATPTRLTVAKLPALVREVDVLIQTLAAFPSKPGSRDSIELCAGILHRIDEVEAFRQSLRPGPLEAIVGKQAKRLEVVLQFLQSPSETHRKSFLGMQTIPPRVLPVSSAKKSLRATQKPVLARKHNEIRITRAPKPIYKWERRRTDAMQHCFSHASGSGLSASPSLGLRSELRQLTYVDQDSHEAAMELRPCTEPGHYLRGASAFGVDAQVSSWTFEFQLILTEEELKSLKFQRRRLEAEQRHLQRQQLPDPRTRST